MEDMPEKAWSYLNQYGCDRRWDLVAPAVESIDTIIVIPALAESGCLFRTLASISRNGRDCLARTMVICVVNNGPAGMAQEEHRRDNERTISILLQITRKSNVDDDKHVAAICDSNLVLGWIDASSQGRELPFRGGGVGLARKIGMDRALEIFDYGKTSPKILLCLDADTLVDDTWLSVVRKNFETRHLTAAAIEYAHRSGNSPEEDNAVCLYETFMRFYLLGLQYARSRYAYHSIGSTIAVTADGYVAVRGMPRREAGEDFHFLNKLAKINGVAMIKEARVYPSSRSSHRVPFGTGHAITRCAAHGHILTTAWNPQVFRILRDWIDCLAVHVDKDAGLMLKLARSIHPILPDFLRREGYEPVWGRLRKNSRSGFVSPRQSVEWFDALKTYKLIRYLTKQALPPVPLYEALQGLLELRGQSLPAEHESQLPFPDRRVRFAILADLRNGRFNGEKGN